MSDTPTFWGSDEAATGRAESTIRDCGADGLRALIDAVTRQISDTEQRQGQVLAELQDRLSQLGTAAGSRRSVVPAELAPAFERIEDGLALLAQQLAETHAARSSPQVALPQTAPVDQDQERIGNAGPHGLPAGDNFTTDPAGYRGTADGIDPAQLPLRSALLDAGLRQADAGSRETVHGDPFDMIGAPGADWDHDAEPWDPTSAEALTRVYEASEGRSGSDPDEALEPGHDGPAAARPASGSAGEPGEQPLIVDPNPVGAGIERAWLEERFREIADRIEASMSAAAQPVPLLAITERFDLIEKRFGEVLDEIVQRPDLRRLELVEAEIQDLGQQLRFAAGQLDRLDGIESEIRRLADDPHAIPPAATPVTAQDIELIAGEVASRLTAELAQLLPDVAAAPAAPAPGDDSELKRLIEDVVVQQREAGDQTGIMLDTMQQALIRLLDRMDELEAGRSAETVPPRPVMAAAAPRHDGDGDRREPAFDDRSGEQAPAYSEPRRAADLHGPLEPVTGEDQLEPRAEPLAQAADQEPDSVPAAGEQGIRPVPQSRDELIAAARRAMRQAAAQQAAAEAVQDADGIEAGPEIAKPPRTRAGVRERKVGGARTLPSRVSVLATVLGLVIALGAGYLVVDKFMGPKKATKIERRLITPETESRERTGLLQAPASTEGGIARASAADGTDGQTPSFVHRSAVDGSILIDGIVLDPLDATQEPAQIALYNREQRAARASMQNAAMLPVAQSVPAALLPTDPASAMLAASQVAQAQTVAQTVAPSQSRPVAGPAADSAPAPKTIAVRPDANPAAGPTTGAATGSRPQAGLPPATVGPLSLRLAAANGDPSAEFEVGARLAQGKGTQQSLKEAVTWYQRSASRGFALAQYRLASMYERGFGVKADAARAKSWYLRAAEQGTVKAMHNLAVLSAGPSAARPDYATAANWFQRAAERGLADSQFNLGVLYENGLGVGQDAAAAYKWYSLAAKGGDAEADRRREAIRARLAPQELSAVEAEVSLWRAAPVEPMANDAHVAGEAWKRNPADGGPTG